MDFFNNAVSQVGAQTELRVGRRTVQTQRRLAEGLYRFHQIPKFEYTFLIERHTYFIQEVLVLLIL